MGHYGNAEERLAWLVVSFPRKASLGWAMRNESDYSRPSSSEWEQKGCGGQVLGRGRLGLARKGLQCLVNEVSLCRKLRIYEAATWQRDMFFQKCRGPGSDFAKTCLLLSSHSRPLYELPSSAGVN